MPRTASTRSIDGDRLRSRPVTPRSARLGVPAAEIAAELPPILFRLPALAPSPLDTEQLAPAEDQASLARRAQATSMRDVPESATDSACVADCSAGPVHAPPVTLETFGAPSISESENAAATETAPAIAARVAAVPTAAVSTELKRTWWEHWSSGVVLILLIIALVTASIVALNDGGKAEPDHLASQAESSLVDEFDLSSITIPEITIPSDPAHNNNGLTAEPHSKGTADEALKLATASAPAVAAPAALVPHAMLDQPVGVAAPQLFANGDPQGNAAQSDAGLAVPVMAASNPTVSLELPGAAPPADAGKSAMDGSSPAFYDGASRIMEQQAASVNASGQAWPTETRSANMPSEGLVHSAEGPIDTNLPSYPTILASATGQAKGVDAATTGQYPSQYASSAPAAAVVPSATPDLNGNSLVSEYFKYERMRRAAEESAGNRYPGSTTIAQQPSAGPQSAVAQPLGNSTGFTLGSSQAGTPNAPPLPR